MGGWVVWLAGGWLDQQLSESKANNRTAMGLNICLLHKDGFTVCLLRTTSQADIGHQVGTLLFWGAYSCNPALMGVES